MKMIETLTADNWEDRVLRTKCSVLVDFEAPWCRSSFLEELRNEELFERWNGMLVAGRLDASQGPAIALQYRIHELPSLALFERGRLVKVTSGPSRVLKMARFLFSPGEGRGTGPEPE
jgi:thioredoxin 1